MPKTPRIPIIATGFVASDWDRPYLAQCLANWTQFGARVVCTVPGRVVTPSVKGVKWNRVGSDTPTLEDVIEGGRAQMDAVATQMAIVDNAAIISHNIFQLHRIAAERNLSMSWMATAHAVQLLTIDQALDVDESFLAFFCANQTIWEFMMSRVRPTGIPFIQPVWSGWLANWSSKHIHTPRYHDVTALRAVGRYVDGHQAPADQDLSGFGQLTFNAPTREYVSRIKR